MREFFYPEKHISLGSVSLGLIVALRNISKANILKGCSLGLSQCTLSVLLNLIFLSFDLWIIYLNVIMLYLRLSEK